jgi:hypothetical protein
VPNYYEAGLRSRSDPGVAFGPVPDEDGHFSWANGARLYYSDLATNLTDTQIGGGLNTTTAIAVSHIDDVTPSRIADQTNWSEPVLVTGRSSSTAGFDKEQIWADNAATSPFFGYVYVCFVDFHSFSRGNGFPLFPFVATSTDGGLTWTTRLGGPPVANLQQGSRTGCTVRTDSQGVVYAFYARLGAGIPGVGSQTMIKSFDGGRHWTRPVDLFLVNDACWFFDPVSGRCVGDGIAGARIDLAAAPSLDIANGAPSGEDATDQLVLAWSDGTGGQNHEKTLFAYSTGSMWKLVEAFETDEQGTALPPPLGLHPMGFVIFEAERMIVAVCDDRSAPSPDAGRGPHPRAPAAAPGSRLRASRGLGVVACPSSYYTRLVRSETVSI